MKLVYFYAALGVACALWNNIVSGMIYFDLRGRGESVNFFLQARHLKK